MASWIAKAEHQNGWDEVMSRNVILPYFPVPPQEYDHRFLAEVIRSFSLYLQTIQNPGEGRFTFAVMTEIQSHDQGLEPGGMFQVDGVVRIALLNNPYVAGNEATGYVGEVTVITS